MEGIYRFVVTAMVCLVSLSTHAQDVILVPPLIPYEKPDTASEDVRKECDWNATMPRYLAEESKGQVKVAEQDIDSPTGKKLALVTVRLHTLGGGGWTGPKWIVLEGRLTEAEKVLGSFEARRQTIGGSMRGCRTLTKLSEEITEDILEWLKTPTLDAKLGDAK